MSKAGEAIYLSLDEQRIIREALLTLSEDYVEGHPEQHIIDKVINKMRTAVLREAILKKVFGCT